MDEGQLKLSMMLKDWSWEAHWESRMRRRDFDNRIQAVEKVARRLGTFVAQDDAQKLANTMFDAASNIQTRQTIFDKMRIDIVPFVTQTSDDTPLAVEIFRQGESVLVTRIFAMEFQKIVDRITSDDEILAKAFCMALAAKPEHKSEEVKDIGLSFGLLPCIENVVQAQNTLVMSLVEKLWRQTDSGAIIKVVQLLKASLVDMPCGDIGALQVGRTEIMANGWVPQARKREFIHHHRPVFVLPLFTPLAW